MMDITMNKFNVDDWKIPNDLKKQLSSFKGKIITRFPPEPR